MCLTVRLIAKMRTARSAAAGFAITGFGTVFSCLAWVSEKRLSTRFTLAFNHCRSAVRMLVPPVDTAFIGAVFFSYQGDSADRAKVGISLKIRLYCVFGDSRFSGYFFVTVTFAP